MSGGARVRSDGAKRAGELPPCPVQARHHGAERAVEHPRHVGIAHPLEVHQCPRTRLPRQAYRDLLTLNDAGAELPALDAAHAAAHRRLVARFVRHHLGESGALRALDFWEHHAWVTPPPRPAHISATS